MCQARSITPKQSSPKARANAGSARNGRRGGQGGERLRFRRERERERAVAGFTEKEIARELERRRKANVEGGQESEEGAIECIHCGNPFLRYQSSAGEHGLCQSCLDAD